MASNPTSTYLGFCVIYKNNVEVLPRLLESIAGHADHVSFTDTGSTDGSRGLVEAFLEKHRGALTDFEWCDDFAAARNVSLEASTSRWRIFLDTDDRLIDGEKIRPYLMRLEAQRPEVEALFVPYGYGPLEVLDTMRCVRYRPGWAFVDAIHERLEFSGKPLPEQAFLRTKEFSVEHLAKTDEEKSAAISRNARIARSELERTTDTKYSARLKRTIAMEMKAQGKLAEAIPMLEPVYNEYRTYPEGRQAAADIAKALVTLAYETEPVKSELLDPAMGWATKAGPAYEAMVHHARGELEACLKAVTRSVGRGRQTTHEGYAFEEGSVFIAGARALMRLGGPNAANQADRLIARIPADVKATPSFQPVLDGVREAIDRITIVVPGTPQPFDENGGSGGMLGGSEEAVVYLVRALAGLGRNVRVYGVLPPHRLPGPDALGVDWQPVTEFNPSGEHGTLVLWRSAQMALKLAEQKVAGVPMGGIYRSFLWLHDSGFGLPPDYVATASKIVNGSVVLSDFHAKQVAANGLAGGMIKLSNGIWEDDFERFIGRDDFDFGPLAYQDLSKPTQMGRDPNRVVYSSCPTRGLLQLLEMWPDVKAACPDAYLDIYYDWSMTEMMQPDYYAKVVAAYEAVKHLSVTHHGGVSHDVLHEALRGANVWGYSHFSSPDVETFCISSVKALACGATVLTVPNGALEEVAAGDAVLCRTPMAYRQKLIDLLRNPESVEVRREKARRAIERFGWVKAVAPRFSEVWSRRSTLRRVEDPAE